VLAAYRGRRGDRVLRWQLVVRRHEEREVELVGVDEAVAEQRDEVAAAEQPKSRRDVGVDPGDRFEGGVPSRGLVACCRDGAVERVDGRRRLLSCGHGKHAERGQRPSRREVEQRRPARRVGRGPGDVKSVPGQPGQETMLDDDKVIARAGLTQFVLQPSAEGLPASMR
jgi:hypothetical protein